MYRKCLSYQHANINVSRHTSLESEAKSDLLQFFQYGECNPHSCWENRSSMMGSG